jgi:tetratricopeptide (TPR) repeat protein
MCSPSAIACMSSCARCLYDAGKYQEAGDVFVAAARVLSTRSTHVRQLAHAPAHPAHPPVHAYGAPDGHHGVADAVALRAGQGTDAQDARLVRDAVRCYRKAGLLVRAVDVLVELNKMEMALRLLKEEHKYDKALQVLDRQCQKRPIHQQK